MSKQRSRKRMPSGSPEDSLGEEIEFLDVPIKTKMNSKAGIQGARPKPKVTIDDPRSPTSYRGTPSSRIRNSLAQVEKRTTRSTTESSKKREIPIIELEARSKKKMRANASENEDNFPGSLTSPKTPNNLSSAPSTPKSFCNVDEGVIPFTPSQKGKSKAAIPLFGGKKHNNENDDNISDDWDEAEMQVAFNNSRGRDVDNNYAEGSRPAGRNDEDEDDPFTSGTSKNAMPMPPDKEKKFYLEDYENFTVKSLPKDDESFFPQVQDKHLRKQYRNLPPLRVGYLLSWSTSTEDIPHIPYSQWPDIISTMDIGKGSSLMNMITMDKSGRFFNPSRASPMDFIVRETFRGRRDAFVANKPAVAIATGYCTESNLIRGKHNNKSIAILFHGQEWERYCCFLTMIFNAKKLYAQVYKSALSFSTLPESVSRPPSISNANVSPLSGRSAKINQTPAEKSRGVLFFSDKVPVFDAREISFDSSIDFDNLPKIFPNFEREVPIGSCVAVGHSVSTYPGKKGVQTGENVTNLSTNVLFVIVFGVPY